MSGAGRLRLLLVWAGLAVAIAAPLAAAAMSPLLAWREPVYIAAGFAGIIGMALLLLQPLLAGGYLPGLPLRAARRAHRRVGGGLVIAVVIHVGGLWITSPPDVVDALLFTSPTPFSAWGVIAMWAVFAAALLAVFRHRLGLRVWRRCHAGLALVIVGGSIIHALLIEGTMEVITKTALCALTLVATLRVIAGLKLLASAARPTAARRRADGSGPGG